MADDGGIIDVYRIREVTGIGAPRVFPKTRVAKKKRAPLKRQGKLRRKQKRKSLPSQAKVSISRYNFPIAGKIFPLLFEQMIFLSVEILLQFFL